MRGPRNVIRAAIAGSPLPRLPACSCLTAPTTASLHLWSFKPGTLSQSQRAICGRTALLTYRGRSCLTYPRNVNASPPPCKSTDDPPLRLPGRYRVRPASLPYSMSGICILLHLFLSASCLATACVGSPSARLVPHTLDDDPPTLRATVRYFKRLEHLSVIQNVFSLAAFFCSSPLTLLALRLARLRWPLGGCAVRGSGHPALRPDCHPGTTACHSAIVHARRVCDAFPCSIQRGGIVPKIAMAIVAVAWCAVASARSCTPLGIQPKSCGASCPAGRAGEAKRRCGSDGLQVRLDGNSFGRRLQ